MGTLFSFFAVDWNLQINPVSIEDDGRYQCQMTPLRSRYAYLNVWKTPEDPFVENGPIIKVKESVEVKLTCVARNGKPPAKVSAAMALKMYNYDDFCCYSRTRNHKSFWRKKDAGFSQLVQKMPILHSLVTSQNSSFLARSRKRTKWEISISKTSHFLK